MYCAIIECTAIGPAANPTIRLMPEVAAICVGIRLRRLHRLRSMHLECSYVRNGPSLSAFPLLLASLASLSAYSSLSFSLLPPSLFLVSWSRPLVSPLRSPQVVRDRSALLRSRPCVNTRLPEIDDPSRSFICDPDSPPCVVYVCARARMSVCVCARLLLQSAYNNDPLRSTHVSHLDGRISGALVPTRRNRPCIIYRICPIESRLQREIHAGLGAASPSYALSRVSLTSAFLTRRNFDDNYRIIVADAVYQVSGLRSAGDISFRFLSADERII